MADHVAAADRAASERDFAAAAHHLERAVADRDDDPLLWTKLSAMRRAGGDLGGAIAAIDRALALRPLDFSALLARAILLDRTGKAGADEAYAIAAANAPEDDALPEAMRPSAALARTRGEAYRDRREAALTGQIDAIAPGAVRLRLERFVSNVVRRTTVHHQQPSHFHYPGLPEIEFHERAEFPFLGHLEAQTAIIRSEFEALMAAEAGDIVPYIQYPDRVPLRQWQEPVRP